MILDKPAAYYDDYFENDRGFHLHYRESFYFVHWTQAIVFLRKIKQARILEIGCGTGQFAEYLNDEQMTEGYSGFDFSGRAIEMARERVSLNFFQGDALEKKNFAGNYNTVICLEVLEHIRKDLDVLRLIRPQTHIIFSVPNFDAPSHVRWFTSERQLKKRFFRLIDIKEIIRVGNIYMCRGIVNPFRPTWLQRLLASREQVTTASFTKRLRHLVKNLLKIKDWTR